MARLKRVKVGAQLRAAEIIRRCHPDWSAQGAIFAETAHCRVPLRDDPASIGQQPLSFVREYQLSGRTGHQPRAELLFELRNSEGYG
jgi:hypothetical protein